MDLQIQVVGSLLLPSLPLLQIRLRRFWLGRDFGFDAEVEELERLKGIFAAKVKKITGDLPDNLVLASAALVKFTEIRVTKGHMAKALKATDHNSLAEKAGSASA